MVAASLDPARSVQAPTRASTEMVPGEAEEEGEEGSRDAPAWSFAPRFFFLRKRGVSDGAPLPLVLFLSPPLAFSYNAPRPTPQRKTTGKTTPAR